MMGMTGGKKTQNVKHKNIKHKKTKNKTYKNHVYMFNNDVLVLDLLGS